MLDALSNERPEMLRMKRKHLDIENAGVEPMKEIIGWMRINAERERIKKFKEIASDSAETYYNVLEEFSKRQTEIQ